MRRGPWHQFGDRSQKMVEEQLDHGVGVGVILSPRDLSRDNAISYSEGYHDRGAHVLIDQQFYVPDFSNKQLASYPTNQFRTTVSQLNQISEADLDALSNALRDIHRDVHADGIIAPAVVYEASRPDILKLNSQLFDAARRAADELSLPTYATIVLGNSVIASQQVIDATLSHATALNSDGWYYAFEFDSERIPSSHDAVRRCCMAGLSLACTGKPLLHAYAGPMSLLSLGFGATATAVGHSQVTWKFSRGRWQPPAGQGGGGDAPPRYFSRGLWGTIVYPDEMAQLGAPLRDRVTSQSPFSTPVGSNLPWGRWDANKHLLFVVCSTISELAANEDPRENARSAIDVLNDAITLHNDIASSGLALSDQTNIYQQNWITAMTNLLSDQEADFDYLSLLGQISP